MWYVMGGGLGLFRINCRIQKAGWILEQPERGIRSIKGVSANSKLQMYIEVAVKMT